MDSTYPSVPDVFISYSSRDRSRVIAIADALESVGVRVWLDRERIAGGANYGSEIVRGIRGCKVLLLMCSDAALRSKNVKQEVQLAWKYDRPYLPLLLDEISFPEQIEYWLEGWQWIEVLARPKSDWLPDVMTALSASGISARASDHFATDVARIAVPPAAVVAQPTQASAGLEGLRAIARFTDQVWPMPAGKVVQRSGPALRDLGAPQDDVQHGYRVGDRVSLAMELEKPGHLLMLDEGPSGTVYCLCPSWFAPNPQLPAGRNYLPQSQSKYDAFAISGKPGREHLLAVISEVPLGFDWMPPDPRVPARVLLPEDIERLLARLRELEDGQWIALSTYFEVLP